MTQGSIPKAGSGGHPVQETPGRVGPEPSSIPVPAPWGHPGTPGRVGKRRVLGCACQHRGPPRVTPQHRGLGLFRGFAGGRAVEQWQSMVQPLPEHPAPALLSHTAPPQQHALPPLPHGRKARCSPHSVQAPTEPFAPDACCSPAPRPQPQAVPGGRPGCGDAPAAPPALPPTSTHRTNPEAAPRSGHHQHQQDAPCPPTAARCGSGVPLLPTFSLAENGDPGLVGVPGSESSSSSSTLSRYPMASSSSSMAGRAAGRRRGPREAPGKGLTQPNLPSLTQPWMPATAAG